MLRWRFATALVLAPAIIGAIYWGRLAVVCVVLLFTALAAYELSRALQPLPYPAVLGAAVLPILLAGPLDEAGVLAGVMLALPWTLFWIMALPQLRTLRSVLAPMMGAVWIGAAFAHIVLLVELPETVIPVLVAVVGPWVSDTGAYFSGRLFGRRLIFPLASPKKTFEGAAGGLVLTVAVLVLASFATDEIGLLTAIILGLVVSFFSQAGDLFESLLKRMLEIKDFGTIFPGHGGALDRIDSLLFTAPAVYYTFLIL